MLKNKEHEGTFITFHAFNFFSSDLKNVHRKNNPGLLKLLFNYLIFTRLKICEMKFIQNECFWIQKYCSCEIKFVQTLGGRLQFVKLRSCKMSVFLTILFYSQTHSHNSIPTTQSIAWEMHVTVKHFTFYLALMRENSSKIIIRFHSVLC